MRAGPPQPMLRSVLLQRPSLAARSFRRPAGCSRTFAQIREPNTLLAFTPSIPYRQDPPNAPNPESDPSNSRNPDHPPQSNDRTLKLGQTLRILQPLLPTLLASPLPQEILSPHISLHLFPSTHPHLPTVSGRVAYHAALWTSPITWGKIPLVGNVHLEILSERMIKSSGWYVSSTSRRRRTGLRSSGSSGDGNENGGNEEQDRGNARRGVDGGEKLVVRWRTMNKTLHRGTGGSYKGISGTTPVDKITAWLGGDEKRDDREFCGKFIFEFDEEGRILEHVIERVEEDGESAERWENGMGRVVGLTDWLLGRLGGNGDGQGRGEPGLALVSGSRRRGSMYRR